MGASAAFGFRDPVFDAQRAFRAILAALAQPGSVQSFETDLAPPRALPPGLAIAALTLVDHEAPLWLDAALDSDPEVAAYLRFHTGAPIVRAPEEAAFALVAAPAHCPPVDCFAQGTLEYPDRSTTVVLAADCLTDGLPLAITGPGILGEGVLAARPLPEGIVAQWAANVARFPRGVDLLIADGSGVVGLPRTTRIRTGGKPCM